MVLPTLSHSQQFKLDSPLTLDEVQRAVASFPASQASGDDGIPIEVYTRYGELILPKHMIVFNAEFESHCLPESTSGENIGLLLKPGKDPLDLESYRLISLIQSDVQILAKVLAQCLNEVIYVYYM